MLAIVITIMVLEMKAPHATNPDSLRAVQRVSGMTLWANLHLLFWLSLIPFATSWMG